MARGNASPALKQARIELSKMSLQWEMQNSKRLEAEKKLRAAEMKSEASDATIRELRGHLIDVQRILDRFLPPTPEPIGPFKDTYGCNIQGPITDANGTTIE